ncbi:aspartyl/asparaginyl beta-hydroxylase domain-containing protein [Hymenobacter persicinus]|uniref:Aspartyl/asparaginyl beta-hydroxylase domain-containing protein n=1 Tax=Hymenobacter persicinus TaxID=2025506 RepID=A0A4Q5LEX6_9BACT|nr:aspartyl/asparaginyl beta-hydroxylase domain-containing protein [Hymenobacter persicinus]RYU83249.1 aspartyl/asparaginyl beta-hydroxylase domain-containing protein [Hymenobacter persicinus]
MIKYIRFDQQFDAARLQQELTQLEAAQWYDHYNRQGYEGSWSTLQLRAPHGRPDNNVAAFAGTSAPSLTYQDTPLLAQCPYIREVLDFFRIEKTSVRLMKLEAGAVIKPHHDHDLNFEQGEVRLHVPVTTNPQLKFYLEQERLVMQEGSCWYLNLARQHSVRNDGPTDRVHLVIDGLVNDWLRQYIHDPRHHTVTMPDPSPNARFSPADQLRMIDQLRQLGTATADKLADEMQAALPPAI